MSQQTCDLAASLAARVDREPALKRMAPVALNIVCFRYLPPQHVQDTLGPHGVDRLNADIVADLQESGIAAPSTTMVDGVLCIRAAIVNHRTNDTDITIMVDAVLEAACKRMALLKGTEKKPPAIHRGQVYREASRLGDAGAKDPFPASSAGTLAALPP